MPNYKEHIRRLASWYFSKNTLPYWCVLAIDCIIIVFAGMLATYFVQGENSLTNNFWYILRTWCLTLPFFIIGMRLFHTYSGIMRYSSTIDMMRQAFALMVGFILVLIIRELMTYGSIIHSTRRLTFVVMFLLALFGQWALRIIIKYLYEVVQVTKNRQKVAIYGVKEGGISIALTISLSYFNKFIKWTTL